MAKQISTFFMFNGQAESALNLYTSVFSNAKIKNIQKYGASGPGIEGTVMTALFTINSVEYMAIDSAVKHDFSFTPAINLFVLCDDEKEFNHLFENLGKDGKELMPPGNYGFSQKFTWIEDRFGVSWQLNLE